MRHDYIQFLNKLLRSLCLVFEKNFWDDTIAYYMELQNRYLVADLMYVLEFLLNIKILV